MPRPVCVKCEVELRPEENGVVVAEMFQQNKEVAKLWYADLFKCPICGIEVIYGFGNAAFKHHFDEDFNATLEELKKNGKHIIYNKELKYA